MLKDRPAEPHPQVGDWLANNVYKPFVNGTGVIQVYDTIADKPVSTYEVKKAPTFSASWCAQSLSGAAGAIVPFVVAGKMTGLGMRALGEGLSLQGGTARFLASESVAQVAGAGLYEFAQKPMAGQTRTGNAAGAMAGFAVFGAGERALAGLTPAAAEPVQAALTKGIGRVAIGAVGGLGSYETANRVSGLLGVHHLTNWEERFESMAQGGFVNLALPVVQEGASRVLDKAVYSQPGSKGMPIDREIKTRGYQDPELNSLVHDNALARVKRVTDMDSQADVPGNRVLLTPEDGAARLAHEMTHLKLARSAEPMYKQLADLSKTEPELAEHLFYGLRAEMELAARQAESRVQARAGAAQGKSHEPAGAAQGEGHEPAGAAKGKGHEQAGVAKAGSERSDIQTIGREQAAGGKTYDELWQAEWEQFKANTAYRPPVEYGGIVKTTRQYEDWMAKQIDVVKEDLQKKHVDMASDPFKFLRATYYRWTKMFPKVCDDLQDAPKVRSVGDLHVDNFGTWLDKFKRLVWGVNDFDEAYKLPYTNDLVRLMTSANVMRKQGQLKIGLKEACDTLIDGYRHGLEDGGKPFVLSGDNGKLAKIARGQMPDAAKYWEHLTAQIKGKSDKNVPTEVSRALRSIVPKDHDSLSWGHRQAGEGSLGRERFVVVGEANGDHFAGEAKAQLPSASYFGAGKKGGRSYYNSTIENAVRSPDPFVSARDGWVVRRLAPDRAKIELGSFPRVEDEKLLLWSMGYETANIHLGTKNAAPMVLADLDARPLDWLRNAVKAMTESTIADHKKWKNHMDK